MDTDQLTLSAYTAAIDEGWTECELLRAILHFVMLDAGRTEAGSHDELTASGGLCTAGWWDGR